MNQYFLTIALTIFSLTDIYGDTPAETALKDILSYTATTPQSEKLSKITSTYEHIAKSELTITHDELNKLTAAANKTLFNNAGTPTLSLVDQDLLKSPHYGAYKTAAETLNTTTNPTPLAIIWR